MPRVQLDHLDVVDGLSGNLHPSILAFHNSFLNAPHEATLEKVAHDRQNKHAQASAECHAKNVEGDSKGCEENERDLDNIGDLVTDPVEALGINLDEVDDLAGREVLVCRARYPGVLLVDESDYCVGGATPRQNIKVSHVLADEVGEDLGAAKDASVDDAGPDRLPSEFRVIRSILDKGDKL